MGLYQGTERLCPITNGNKAILTAKNITQNGRYDAIDDHVDGYSLVSVDVQPTLQTKIVTQNGDVTADSGYYGLSKVTVNVSMDGDIYNNPYEITPTKASIGDPSQEQWDIYYAPYNIDNVEYAGLGKIKVKKIGAWIDSEISADNIRLGHTILGVAGNVTELLPETKTVKSGSSVQVITPSPDKNGITQITVEPILLQNITNVTPKGYSITINKDYEYDGINSVQINAVSSDVDSNIKPENIKKNVSILGVMGTYDNYVPPVTTTLTVDPSILSQEITPESGVDGFNKVIVNPVTASIDENIVPRNIRRDIQILGVTGSYVPETLQDKTVTPTQSQQVVTYDSGLGYDGLNSVTVNPVTASIDEDIIPSNIKKDVTILGVTGSFEGDTINVQSSKNATPTTSAQEITPDEGYDALGKVNISAVTASIDPNILAENIKKNIQILGVTGSFEGGNPSYQESKTVEPSTNGDIIVTPDSNYDALLKVIVKAVTASIDPNILPQNIKKNVSILGVLGTLEQGEEQKWFDFDNISEYIAINQSTYGEGGIAQMDINPDETDYELKKFIDDEFEDIKNINAVLFTIVNGYDDEEVTDDIIEQIYIMWIGGNLYENYSEITYIPTQMRYFYPFVNENHVNGMTFGLPVDDGSARTMKVYVLTSDKKDPVSVLSTTTFTQGMLPEDYNGFRYVKDIQIPAHTVYEPKTMDDLTTHWVLPNQRSILTKVVENESQPNNVYTSALDIDYGIIPEVIGDKEIQIVDDKWSKVGDIVVDETTHVASNFSRYNYITYPIPNNAYLDMIFNITPSNISSSSYIWNCNNDYIRIYNSCLRLYSYNMSNASTGTYTLSANTKYWIRCILSGGLMNVYILEDDGTYTLNTLPDLSSWTLDIANKDMGGNRLMGQTMILGMRSTYYFYGTMDLNGIGVKDSTGDFVYRIYNFNVYHNITNHQIFPIQKDLLFVERRNDRKNIKYTGDEVYQINDFNITTLLATLNTSDYLNIKSGSFNTNNASTWEIASHLKTIETSSSSTIDNYIASWTTGNLVNQIFLETTSGSSTVYVLFYTAYNTGSWIFAQDVGQLSLNTEYYCKFGFNGNSYYAIVSVNSDYSNPVINWTTSNATKTYTNNSNLTLFNNASDMTKSLGKVYLDDYTYVKLNNEIIWKTDTYGLRGNLVNYVDDGEAVTLNAYLTKEIIGSHYNITDTNIIGSPNFNITNQNVSGFNANNYLQLGTVFNPETNIWEMVFKFKQDEISTYWKGIFGSYGNDFSSGVHLFIQDGYVKFELSDNNTSWNITNGTISSSSVITANTWYWVKLEFTGTNYNLYLSSDGLTWNLEGTLSSSSTIISLQPQSIGGTSWTTSDLYMLNGSIDLSESYIKIGNDTWWKPVLTEENDYRYDYVFSPNDNWSYNGLIKEYPCSFLSSYGKFTSASVTTARNEDKTTWLYIVSVHTEQGTIPIILRQNAVSPEINLNYFESDTTSSLNSATWDSTNEKWINTIASDGSGSMTWVTSNGIGADVYSYTAATAIDWDYGYTVNNHPSVTTNKYFANVSSDGSTLTIYNEQGQEVYIIHQSDTIKPNYVGTVTVPKHYIYTWDNKLFQWRSAKNITITVNDEDTILYTDIDEI